MAARISTPPPALRIVSPLDVPPKRLPISRMRSLRRQHGVVRAAEIFDRVVRDYGLTNADVGEDLGVSRTVAARMRWPRRDVDSRAGDVPARFELAPVLVGDVFAMQRRLALAFLDALRVAVLSEPHQDGA